jgi:hypothetical protein
MLGEIGAADVGCRAGVLAVQDVRLGVKALTRSGLEDAHRRVIAVLLRPVEHAPQCARLGDIQVVAGQQPQPALPREEVEDERLNLIEARVRDERHRQVESGRVRQVCRHGIQQRMLQRAMYHGRLPRLGVSHLPRGPQVIALARNDMAHAAAWIEYVAFVPGNHMHMQMWNCLSRRVTDVNADVVAGGVVAGFDGVAGGFDSCSEGGVFCVGCLEPIGHMAIGDDQGVAVGHREAVPEAGDQVGLVEHRELGTESRTGTENQRCRRFGGSLRVVP